MSSLEVGIERRLSAPHPGPVIKRDYVDAIGVEVSALAASIGVECSRLEEMFEGRRSIDVDTAIRLARSLALPAERVMQMQLRADFARARSSGDYGGIGPMRGTLPFTFPDTGYLSGHLGRSGDEPGGQGSFFFQETVAPGTTERYAGLHALWRGDRLRIYDEAGRAQWTGPVLQNLDGRTLLPFVTEAEWHQWFASGARADLAIGPDHAEFFARMKDL